MPEKNKKTRVSFEPTNGWTPHIVPNLPTVAKTQKTYTNGPSSVTTTLFISKILHRPQKWILGPWLDS